MTNTAHHHTAHIAASTTGKLARGFAFLAALVAILAALGAPPVDAAAPLKFGAELNPTVQPSNGSPGLPCSSEAPGTVCTMVQNEAYGRPDGGHLAPKSGTIKRLRIIAADPGSIRPQIATVKANQRAKVTYTGPRIEFAGQTAANEESGRYRVESFKVNIPVKKGQQLALRGSVASLVRCSSGGDNTLLYTPALAPGKPSQAPSHGDGCWLLVEAVIR